MINIAKYTYEQILLHIITIIIIIASNSDIQPSTIIAD